MSTAKILKRLPERLFLVRQPLEIFPSDEHCDRPSTSGQLNSRALLGFVNHAREIVSGFRDRILLDHPRLLMAISMYILTHQAPIRPTRTIGPSASSGLRRSIVPWIAQRLSPWGSRR